MSSQQSIVGLDYGMARARQTQSPFFTLPYELRMKIYGYCETAEMCQVGILEQSAYTEENERPGVPEFLLTCHALYLEAKEHLSKNLVALAYPRPKLPLSWKLMAAQGHPQNVTNVVVEYEAVATFDRSPIMIEFPNTQTVQFQWGRPSDLIKELEDPEAVGAGGLAAMLNQCLNFLDAMPNLHTIKLCGYYRKEFPQKLVEALSSRISNLRVFEVESENVIGGRLDSLFQTWQDVLDRVREKGPAWLAEQRAREEEKAKEFEKYLQTSTWGSSDCVEWDAPTPDLVQQEAEGLNLHWSELDGLRWLSLPESERWNPVDHIEW